VVETKESRILLKLNLTIKLPSDLHFFVLHVPLETKTEPKSRSTLRSVTKPSSWWSWSLTLSTSPSGSYSVLVSWGNLPHYSSAFNYQFLVRASQADKPVITPW
jgi:hypothetical protein